MKQIDACKKKIECFEITMAIKLLKGVNEITKNYYIKLTHSFGKINIKPCICYNVILLKVQAFQTNIKKRN